ncbi:hypothetical protein D0C36_16755 [Mucilaginibacter conchicola]|uniref:Lipoprotein n=1 Tax=Mucilaginibacter conchicola TaxID=2303333 RepID=A0A372NNT8_9SPHI|nr:hypothetical protein [Mucilaginibacter conchicola]RFZ90616.1 hypothetical protein D0C36_16755 [Mucilaginibacter conchicola]
MKKLLYLLAIVLFATGCSKTIYHMNRGELRIPKKDTYQVQYITEVAPGGKAKMYYIGADNVQYFEESLTGKFDKTFTIKSGKELKVTIDAKLPKRALKSTLHTIVKVDGEAITDQTQAGENVAFRFWFKLP